MRRLSGDFDDLGQPDWSPTASGSSSNPIGPAISSCGRSPPMAATGASIPTGSIRTIANRAGRPTDGRSPSPPIAPAVTQSTCSMSRPGACRPCPKASRDSEPAWSPDGNRIAYVADGTRLMVSDLDGNAEQVETVIVPHDNMRASGHPGRAPFRNPRAELRAGREPRPYPRRRDQRAADPITAATASWRTTSMFSVPPGSPMAGCCTGRPARSGGRTQRGGFGRPVLGLDPGRHAQLPQEATRLRCRLAPRPVVGISSPALSPDGRQITFRALNDLWVMPIGGRPRRLVTGPYYKADPAWSPNGKTIAYSTDRGGKLDLWLHDIASGRDRQLTNLARLAGTSCSWSRDGRSIAFLDQDTHLHVIDVASGAVRQIYDRLFEPGRPSFSPDGRYIALAAMRPKTPRYREGANQLLVIDLETGKGLYQAHAPGKSLGTRGDDGPVWSPDGRHLAYVFASTLWVVPVDPAGSSPGRRANSPPRRPTRRAGAEIRAPCSISATASCGSWQPRAESRGQFPSGSPGPMPNRRGAPSCGPASSGMRAGHATAAGSM